VSGATHLYAIAIGSNRPHGHHGRPPQVIEAAIARLDRDFDLFDASPILINPAHGPAGRDFANAVALVQSGLSPVEMLTHLKAIERDFGRRSSRRWGPRVLDLDIALWSGGGIRSRRLTIPHPHLAERTFVLQPLAAIAADWKVRSLTVRQMAGRLARKPPRG
jgi:2-amino-4-hydroxy-6-hydroxymethyldihydropteridine diphosphokinase